ncbi:MAG: response regulator [Phycisphaerae bacterium]
MALAAIVTDLIFSTKIVAEARAQKRQVRVLRSYSVLSEFLRATPPDMLIVDMNCGGINPLSAIALAKTSKPSCKIVAYLSHTQQDLAQQAMQAGAEQVVPRSEFVVLLPTLVQTYADAAAVSEPAGIENVSVARSGSAGVQPKSL